MSFRKIGKAHKAFTYEVFESDVKELKEKRDQWCMTREAYEFMGVSQYLFEQMNLADVIAVDKKWKSDILKSGPVSKPSLESLCLLIKKRKTPSFEGKSIEIKKIASLKLGEHSKTHQIFQAVYDGRIKVVSCLGKFGDVKISLDDVYRILQVSEQGKGYSIEELGKITGWKWESIGHWMDCGLLDFDKYQIKGRSCRFITSKHLIDFQRKYIPTADLMKQIGRSTAFLKNNFPSLPIVGEKIIPGGKLIGGLVNLSEWVRLSLNLKSD